MPSIDEHIARQLQAAAESGELRAAPSYGKPLARAEGWDETPEELRMPFKALKDAGFVPPEVELFHARAELRRKIEVCTDDAERHALQRELSDLEQRLSLRLEALRVTGSL